MNSLEKCFFVIFCLLFFVFTAFSSSDECCCKDHIDEETRILIRTENMHVYYDIYPIKKLYSDSINNFKLTQKLLFYLIDSCFFYENTPQFVKQSRIHGSMYSLRFEIVSCVTDVESLEQILDVLKQCNYTYCDEINMTVDLKYTFDYLLKERLAYLKNYCKKKKTSKKKCDNAKMRIYKR